MNELLLPKRISELETKDRIGQNGWIFITRDHRAEAEAKRNGKTMRFVKAQCPFCGSIKTYNYDYLKNGKSVGCGCKESREYNQDAKRFVDDNGRISYQYGYPMNFGWNFMNEAGVDTYGNRIVYAYSRWNPNIVKKLPIKELDPVLNPSGFSDNASWADSYVDSFNTEELLLEAEEQNTIFGHNVKAGPGAFTTISFEVDGRKITTAAQGEDERYMKELILRDPETRKAIQSSVYVCRGEFLGIRADNYYDRNAKWADFKTSFTVNRSRNVEVYEEYDGSSHPINKPKPRDVAVELDCDENNLGLFRLSTNLKVFKERNDDVVLAIRNFALNFIRQNIVNNRRNTGAKLPVLVRVTTRRHVEAGIERNGEIVWSKIKSLSDFYAPKKVQKNTENQDQEILMTKEGVPFNNEYVETHQNIVYKIINKYSYYNSALCNKEDFFQEGMLGMAKAFATYDSQKGASLETWITRCVKDSVAEYIKKNSHCFSGGAYLHNARRKLSKELGCDITDVTTDMLIQYAAVSKKTASALSLYQLDTVSYGPELALIDYKSKQQFNRIGSLIEDLPKYLNPQEIDMITKYFNLDGEGSNTMRGIGESCGKSRKAVSYAINRILFKLKHVPGIEDYWFNSDNFEDVVKTYIADTEE